MPSAVVFCTLLGPIFALTHLFAKLNKLQLFLSSLSLDSQLLCEPRSLLGPLQHPDQARSQPRSPTPTGTPFVHDFMHISGAHYPS